MKRILILFLLANSLFAASQTLPGYFTPISTSYEWNWGRFKNGLRLPLDTLPSAEIGSLAHKGGVVYAKLGASWTALGGSGGGADSSLFATRFHAANTYQPIGNYLTSSSLTNYYTKSQVGAFFSGASPIGGYNKTNWDAAYSWGNHNGLYPTTSRFLDSIYAVRASFTIGAGDMTKAIYDINNDGIADDAEKLGGQLPSYYATAAALALKANNSNTVTVNGNTQTLGANPNFTVATSGTLNDLTDVAIATALNNQLLRYNSGTGQWENWTPNFQTTISTTPGTYNSVTVNSGGQVTAGSNIAYLTSYTETDPVVRAINGVVKSNGTTISAAVAGTDYEVPLTFGTGLTRTGNTVTANAQTTPTLQQVTTAGNTTTTNITAGTFSVNNSGNIVSELTWSSSGADRGGAVTLKSRSSVMYGTLKPFDNLTNGRVWTFPDKDGTVAMTSDITGTVTNVSGVNTNGFTVGVATPTTTPAITVGTSVTGLLKGNGTSVSAAVAGTDYLVTETDANAILKTGTSTLTGNVIIDGGTSNAFNTTIKNGNLLLDFGSGTAGSRGNLILNNDRNIYWNNTSGPFISANATTGNYTFNTTSAGRGDFYGGIKFNNYGAGTRTGTATYNLAVDADGDIIEVSTSGGGSGETNTASNLGGGLANWDSKSGVDLRFNTFNATDFDLATNLLSIDATLKSTWNAKQNAISLTTTGTSGAATFDGTTLNIPQYSGGSGGHTIQDEGTPLTARANLNFIGTGVTVTDNAGTGATDVTIAGGGSATPAGATTQVQFNNAGSFAASPFFTYGAQTLNLTGDGTVGSFTSLLNIEKTSDPGLGAARMRLATPVSEFIANAYGTDASLGVVSASVGFFAGKGSLVIGTVQAKPIYFFVNDNYLTPQMQLNGGGELLINTTDQGDYKLQVAGNVWSNGTITAAANTYTTGGYDVIVRNQTTGIFEKTTLSGGTTYTAGTNIDLTNNVITNTLTNNNQLTNGAGYTTETSTNTLTNKTIAAATNTVEGILLGVRVLTTGTTYTPTAGTTKIDIEVIGAGGGGGGASGAASSVGAAAGGGAGAINRKYQIAVTNTAYTMAIGAAGTAGANTGATGGTGGNTTLTIGATTYTANGGVGGAGQVAGTALGLTLGGAAGASTNGDINGGGQNGDNGVRLSGTVGISGAGGTSSFGAGGAALIAAGVGNAATGYGAGGGGALSTANTARAGGTGSQGVIIIREYK